MGNPPFPRTGLLDRLFRALHVLRERPGDVRRRSVAVLLVVWVPLLGIQLVEWPLSRRVELPFYDISLYVRFLGAAPLAFLAEDTPCDRCSIAIEQVSTRLDPAVVERIARAGQRLRASPVEAILLVLAFVMSRFGPHAFDVTSGGVAIWYSFVALPLSSFLMLRMLWLWIVWCFLLASFSRFDLHPDPLHPDHSGGLRFLSLPSNGFTVLLMAVSCVVSGAWATQILAGQRRFSLDSAATPVSVLLGIALVVTVGPLFPFAPQIYRARLEGLRRYSRLADAYGHLFAQRWLQGPAGGDVLGTPDIQSLADLSSAQESAEKSWIVPFGYQTLVAVILALCTPLLPLALLQVPFSEAVRKLFGLILG
jgi:hypothetical protein